MRGNEEIMKNIKKITDLFTQFDWFFSTNSYDRQIILKEKDEETEKGLVACRVYYDNIYQRLSVEVFPEFFEHTPVQQRKILLHEMCHTLTIPSRDLAIDLLNGKFVTKQTIMDENERITSKIENLLDLLLMNRAVYVKNAYKDYMKNKQKKEKKKHKKK